MNGPIAVSVDCPPKLRRPHLNLGQRLALLREARSSLKAEADICRKHGLSPQLLDTWRAEFERHHIHEVDLAGLRVEQRYPRISAEEIELLAQLNHLQQALQCKSAEIRALHELLRCTVRMWPFPPPPLYSPFPSAPGSRTQPPTP